VTTDDMILIANKAIDELGLTESQRDYIDGVLTMAMLTQATEYEAQLAEADAETTQAKCLWVESQGERSIAQSALNKAHMHIDALKSELKAERHERGFVATELAAMTKDRDAVLSANTMLNQELRKVTAERDDLRSRQHSTQDAPSLGRIHYAATQPGHLET
jgi:chromosome segregation ATPase